MQWADDLVIPEAPSGISLNCTSPPPTTFYNLSETSDDHLGFTH